MKNDILRIKQVKNMSKCLKFCKMQIGTQTKALDERNWFASRVFLANEKWHFDNQISQKHVKMPQILQNTNRYSNESSRQKELICLKGFSGKWKIGIFKTNFAVVKRSLIKPKKIAVVKRSLRDKYVSFSLEIRSYSVEYLCNFFKLRTICSIVNYAVLT